MMGKTAKRLIIVCDKKTEQYGNYLRQLISTNDDGEEVVGIADGIVEVAVWLEKDYTANKAQISSSEHILFIGDGKESKNEASSMVVKFNKFGMKYGWLGKRAMMQADESALTQDNYNEFIDYMLGFQSDFDKIVTKQLDEENINQINNSTEETDNEDASIISVEPQKTRVARILGKVKDYATYGLVGAKIKDKATFRKKAKDQQYRALAVILYIDGLKDFLEG